MLRGRYRAGERLPSERDLAERFGTTRGVVRVALKKLEQLGLADVRQGGARVVPLEEASLDVVGHLLDLEDPPRPELVDQVLEVVEALMAATVRNAVERGDPGQLARVRDAIGRARTPGLAGDARSERLHDLIHAIMDASDNLVLHIVRRGLRTQIFGRSFTSAPGAPPSPKELRESFDALDAAVEKRAPAAASEAIHALFGVMRSHARRSLTEGLSAAATAAAR